MERLIKVFGAALDATDFPLSLQIKQNYLIQLAQNLIIDPNFLDPYDALLLFSRVMQKDKYHKMGKFPIESWLTPKPNLEDLPLMNQLEFMKFTREGSIRVYSERLEKYINENILPDFPLMIGVDHSLTGGVLKALSHKYGREDLLILIFDAHFDGLPANISLNIAKYMNDHPEETNPLISEHIDTVNENSDILDTYTCASFIYYLLKENIILPENLIIFGCQDYPDAKFRSLDDPRIVEFVEFYNKMEQKGIKFIPKSDTSTMIRNLSTILKETEKSKMYISFDTDVGALREIIATRFRNAIGIDQTTIINAAKIIKNVINSKKIDLVGLDIMEIETHLLNRVFPKSGRIDQTIKVVDSFLDVFF
ncbi:MAG: arginase family protein [Candidatus Lokiarchaeota archaeon]|nr:arginase family protein [Candidatus Lokiarchaeota archaeon]